MVIKRRIHYRYFADFMEIASEKKIWNLVFWSLKDSEDKDWAHLIKLLRVVKRFYFFCCWDKKSILVRQNIFMEDVEILVDWKSFLLTSSWFWIIFMMAKYVRTLCITVGQNSI